MVSDSKITENCLQGCSDSNSGNEDNESLSSTSNEASTSDCYKKMNRNGKFI